MVFMVMELSDFGGGGCLTVCGFIGDAYHRIVQSRWAIPPLQSPLVRGPPLPHLNCPFFGLPGSNVGGRRSIDV